MEPGTLTGYDCPECLNRGWSMRLDDEGRRVITECRCMARRRSVALMERSGLGPMIREKTLGTWRADEPWQENARDAVERFAAAPEGWWYMCGTPGTGKTHLCTALCGLMMERGMECRYMLWRDFSVRAKAAVNDGDEYRAMVEPLKRVKVLYIDDLFKTGKGAEPTPGDVNLAFEIINARYIDPELITVISTELSLGKILDLDEGLGSRIKHRAGRNLHDFHGKRNRRL